jgi:cytoskeleton protein RodZ
MARGTFGERLKRERELREVTLEEITSATRIGPRFLDALENEDWDKLPGGVFNRGFVRAIARYLGLDEEAFLAEYDLAHNSQVPRETPRPEDRIPSAPRWIPFLLILGALILLVALFAGGLYGWRYYRARKAHAFPVGPVTPQTSASPSTSSANSSSLSSPAPSEPSLDLSVSATAPAHVRIESDGYVVFDSDMYAGENHHFYAINAFEVSTSDSAAVLLEMNGQAIPPLGRPGSSGTIKLNRNDRRQAPSGNPRP